MAFSFANGFNAQNAAQAAPSGNYEPIPPGQYLVEVEDCELVSTRAGGQRIKLCAVVCDGQYVRRKIYAGYNVDCPSSQKASEIGQAQFGKVCLACGKPTLGGASELIGLRFLAKIVIKKGTNGYADSNDIADALPAAQAPAQYSAPQQVMPWQTQRR